METPDHQGLSPETTAVQRWVDGILSSGIHKLRSKIACEREKNAASKVVCEEDRKGGGEPGEGVRKKRGIDKCLHISASYLHCPLGDYQHTTPSLPDYRDKIKPEWILDSSNS